MLRMLEFSVANRLKSQEHGGSACCEVQQFSMTILGNKKGLTPD